MDSYGRRYPDLCKGHLLNTLTLLTSQLGKLKATIGAGRRHLAGTKNRRKKLKSLKTRYLKGAQLANMKHLIAERKGVWKKPRVKYDAAPLSNLYLGNFMSKSEFEATIGDRSDTNKVALSS